MNSISKEIFIMALLLMIVVFMIGMVFYKYMPNNKTVPEPIVYSAEASITAVLQEIKASSYGSDLENEEEVQDIIKSYSIGTTELKGTINIPEENPLVYADVDDIVEMIDNNETFIV